MILFHSDLDQTLIYSYRHNIGPEKVCVEIYENRELSYMHPDWMEALKRIQKKALFVPTTVRTVEQYQRIRMGITEPEYALVCAGGILLKHGQRDSLWYQESLRLAEDAQQELKLAQQILEEDRDRSFEIRFIEQLFLFTKSKYPQNSVQRLKERLDLKRVDVYQSGSKLYILPKKLGKDSGVLRLKSLLQADMVLAAGDSELDSAMLQIAQMGFCPQGLFQKVPSSVCCLPKESFTGEMLKRVEQQLKEVFLIE